MYFLFFQLPFWQLLSLLDPTSATGKGPISMYAIDDRYALMSDSLFESLLIVDLKWGGTVSVLRLFIPPLSSFNSSAFSSEKIANTSFLNPTGVASCDTCHYAYLTTTNCRNLYEVTIYFCFC